MPGPRAARAAIAAEWSRFRVASAGNGCLTADPGSKHPVPGSTLLKKVARDSSPDMNEMGRCWEDYSRSGSSMLRPGFGIDKTSMLHDQKAFPSLFRPICLRIQLSGPNMTRRSGLLPGVFRTCVVVVNSHG